MNRSEKTRVGCAKAHSAIQTSRNASVLLSLGLLIALLSWLPLPGFGMPAAEDCVALLGTGNARASSPNTASGSAQFLLNGVPYTAALDLTFAFGASTPDGTTAVASSHRFSVRNKWGRRVGGFQTSDTGTLVPGGSNSALNLELTLTIVNGTGRFQGVTGSVVDRGFLRTTPDAPPLSVSALVGTLCFTSGER